MNEWQLMSTAPRDGTVIEIEIGTSCFVWSDDFLWKDGRWQNANDPFKGLMDEADRMADGSLAGSGYRWRPSAKRGFHSHAIPYGKSLGMSDDGLSSR